MENRLKIRKIITINILFRHFATTKQVANMAAFLSSDEASCVSGAVYVVNGAIEAA